MIHTWLFDRYVETLGKRNARLLNKVSKVADSCTSEKHLDSLNNYCLLARGIVIDKCSRKFIQRCYTHAMEKVK